jgi:sigma-B regulation protein RsbU (phosphoserine phosphatase)
MADASDAGELQRQVRRLEAILDASKILNSTLDFGSLLALILDLAVRNLEATRGTIYLVDQERGELWSKVVKGDDDEAIEIRVGIGVGIAGQVAATGETINVEDVGADPRFFSPFDSHAGLGSRNMLCMPMRNRQGTIIGVFQIIDRHRGAFDAEDERFLAAFADHAAITLETARLHEELVTKRLLDQELQFAATIQQRLLPAGDVRIPGYDVAGAMRPSRSVGGDYFDILPDGDRGAILVVADVAGKGLPAALLVSTLHAALHAYLQADLTFELLLQKLNLMLLETATPERYATLFLADLRTDSHTLRYVNAGHPPPVLLSSAGDRLLTATGVPVGLLPDMTWEVGCVSLRPGDVLIAYSDGITEAADETGEEFGSERLHASARHAAGAAAQTILRISREVDAFARGVQADDQTLLVLERKRDGRA